MDLDDELMAVLLARYPGASKTEAVEKAIREYLSMDAAARALALAGRLDVDDVSSEMRRRDRRT